MTDNEIVKRLERCIKRNNRNYDTDIVLDLINRQQAEIERLRKEDVVPVVRCKNCKHWNNGDCYRIELTRPDDYCSYGERKRG